MNVRRSTVRRSTRSSISLKQMETDHNTKHEERIKINMNSMVNKTLSSYNPQKGKNILYFSYIDRKFIEVVDEKVYLDILDFDESVLYKEDPQFALQDEYHSKRKKLKIIVKKMGEDINETEIDSYKSMRNHLTFAERASGTTNKTIISREVETKKLQRNNQNGIFHQWDLFDTYMCKYIEKLEMKRKEEEAKMLRAQSHTKVVQKCPESLTRVSLLKTLKLLERQIMQIKNSDKYLFYREWNQYDEKQESSKMIFMLLAFPQNASIRNKAVTALCWNTQFEDLFAVGYGSYSFPRKKEEKEKVDQDELNEEMMDNGYIYVFSIKNNYCPEVRYITDSGVLCLDFHHIDYTLLVAGMYDGTVCVYDISQKTNNPYLTCSIRTQRHLDPVWQIKWYTPFNEIGEYVFYSISSDGKVIKWSFFKNKTTLINETVITLKYANTLHQDSSPSMIISGPSIENNINVLTLDESETYRKKEETLIIGNSGGMCFDFNKHKHYEHLFVIGTEEGRLYLSSTQHREHTICSYEGHSMGIYNVAWNPFHPKIFASCSADWTIKIWHYKIMSPLVVYDIQSSVGSLAWSPWCSTIFASVNVAGEIKFFDLNRARKTSLEPKKYQDVPINHIAFNKNEFVFLTGNDKGRVRLWKMAEPLRVTIDVKEQEEKEKLKKEKESNKNNLPTTKINVPPNLQDVTVKTRRTGLQKKEVMKDLNPKLEYERLVTFLNLLDITDV